MSEQVTAKRIWAARTARRFPVILEMVERGELHLTAIHLLARHLTPQNCRDVLQRATHKSSREIERLVAALAPRPDVASRVRALPRKEVGTAQGVGAAAAAASGGDRTRVEPASDLALESSPPAARRPCPAASTVGSPLPAPAARPITALAPRRYKIEITVDEETHDKLRSLQDLLSRSSIGRDPAAIISRAIDSLLVDTLKRKAATTGRPRKASPTREASPEQRSIPAVPACHASSKTPRSRTRTIPAALRRAVWQRDCGRCCYIDGRGRRCNATSNVEFHHKDPFAKGGGHDAGNVELRCAAHNQYQADLDFGRDFMDARRTAGARS